MKMPAIVIWFLTAVWILSGCDSMTEVTPESVNVPEGQQAFVTRVVDGDTIEVRIETADGFEFESVRYVGINTPERDEVCYREATDANAALVRGQTVTLVRDQTDRDRFGRLLRYIYVNNVFVEAELVRQGYAEAVLYQPDDAHYDLLRGLERQAAEAGRGCHPTGIFDDGTAVR